VFKKIPKILAHRAALSAGLFVTPEHIIGQKSTTVANLLHRYCPHRSYPLGGTVGSHVQEGLGITCDFHGMTWTSQGDPVESNCSLLQRTAIVRDDGLIVENFSETGQQWSHDLAQEDQLKYQRTFTGSSNGSWLWMMEIQADLLHIRPNGIHPDLSEKIDLATVTFSHGRDWICQNHSTGWWTFIYPYTFLEWTPGCLGVNYVTPNDPKQEFGFTWNTQFYFAPTVSDEQQLEFISLEQAFCEDVCAIEQQKGPWFPLEHSSNPLEQHCVHWGNWVQQNIQL
jgi:hypothetical protein